MKLKKISEEHYIIVDDSEIKEGDWIYNAEREPSILKCVGKGSLRGWQKITDSTQPLGWLNKYGFTTANLKPDWTNVEYLPLSEVKELLGVADAEKSMWYERNLQNPYPSDSPSNTGFKKGFELGYNQALEDNKDRKYTKEDVRVAIRLATTSKYDHRLEFYSEEEIIQSLQPKTEWEVEFIDGKLQLVKE